MPLRDVKIMPMHTILAILLSLSSPVLAQSVLNISADNVIFDRENKYSSYRGNVVLDDASVQIRANQIDYFKKKDKDNIVAIGSPNQPAIYHNTTDDIKIFAQKIYYKQKNDVITFSGKVILISEDSRLESDEMNYYIKTKKS